MPEGKTAKKRAREASTPPLRPLAEVVREKVRWAGGPPKGWPRRGGMVAADATEGN